MEPSVPPTVVVPVRLHSDEMLDLTVRTLVSVWSTAPGAALIVAVEDGEPEDGRVHQLAVAADELGAALLRSEQEGVAAAVNVGLGQALETGSDAVVVQPGVVPAGPGWLERMQTRTDTAGRPAGVVGARLLHANGLLAHAGVYFSLLDRDWQYRFQHGPGDLPAALSPCRCPVSGQLQLVRHDCLAAVGLWDEEYPGPLADVDFCLRAFAAGFECVYEPSVVAVWHAPATPDTSREQHARFEVSRRRMREVHAATDFSPWVPAVL